MGIDGIGGGGLPPGPGPVAGPGRAGAAGGFSVDGTDEAAPAAEASGALAQLDRGELSLDQYLDLRVEDATGHLEGKLSSEQLDFVKQGLREQLQTDPVLVALVKRATGKSSEVG